MRDLPDEEKEKTLTLKRDKSIAKDQKRLEEMKKKLHTDDESKYQNFNLELSFNSSTGAEDIWYDSDLCYNFTFHIILARHVRSRP